MIRVGAWTDGVRVSVELPGEAAPGAGHALTAGLGLGLARRIAELHGGSLEDAAAGEIVLMLPVA